MTRSKLEAAMAAGDADGCVELLAELTEPERRELAPTAIRSYRDAHREYWSPSHVNRSPPDPVRARLDGAFLAMLGTATLSEIKKAPYGWDARAYDVLTARRPAWLGEWCEWVLSERGWAWDVVRRMVRERLCQRPASDMYFLWMLERQSPKQLLVDDPELLDHEIWELFRIEGNSRLSLSGVDKYVSRVSWSQIFVELAAEGRISRQRLLDRSLDALECDFHQFRAGWFSRFHEALAPSLEERASRSGRYLRLIASRIPPTVSFALKAVQILCRADRVSPEDVLGAIPPAFHAQEKGTVTMALRLAEHSVRADPRHSQVAAGIVVPALEHASCDVRDAVSAFIERCGGSTGIPAAVPAHVEPCSAGEPPVRRALPAAISSVAELVQELSRVIENEGPPEDLERVLDGVSRLCAVRPENVGRLTAPLLKRAEHFLTRSTRGCFAGHAVRPIFCGLAKAWLSGDAPAPVEKPAPGLGGFLGARAREIAARAAARNARPLLASPTQSGGGIDPASLVARMEGAETPDELDLIQALLRLNQQHRIDALESARQIKGEAGEALRYALGAGIAQTGGNPAIWAAASRARNPEKDDPFGAIEFTWHRRENGYHEPRIRIEPPLPASIGVDMPDLLVYKTWGEAPLLRWAATVWPGYREGWFVAGCREIGKNLDWWSAEWGNRVYLEPLLDSATRLSKMGLTLLALGLAAKEAGEGALAADAVAAAIGDGRMTAGLLAAMLSQLFSWDHIKMARVTIRLTQVARLSGLHESVIREGIAAGLPESPPKQPASMGLVLELFYELSEATKSGPPKGKLRELLAGMSGTNRAAVIARKVLKLT
jgi:hypothetical protein